MYGTRLLDRSSVSTNTKFGFGWRAPRVAGGDAEQGAQQHASERDADINTRT